MSKLSSSCERVLREWTATAPTKTESKCQPCDERLVCIRLRVLKYVTKYILSVNFAFQ